MAIKVGTEDKKKVYLAAGLGGVMLILLLRFLWQTFGPSPTAPPAPAPAGHRGTAGHDLWGNTAREYWLVRLTGATQPRRSAA